MGEKQNREFGMSRKREKHCVPSDIHRTCQPRKTTTAIDSSIVRAVKKNPVTTFSEITTTKQVRNPPSEKELAFVPPATTCFQRLAALCTNIFANDCIGGFPFSKLSAQSCTVYHRCGAALQEQQQKRVQMKRIFILTNSSHFKML